MINNKIQFLDNDYVESIASEIYEMMKAVFLLVNTKFDILFPDYKQREIIIRIIKILTDEILKGKQNER